MSLRPKLQVALDLENLEDALKIAQQVAPFVDIIEAGTPLIKSEGIHVVETLKNAFPEKIICADLKTADAGYLEVKMAAKAKADIVSILADAYENTIEGALRASLEFKVEIMADLIVSRSPIKRLKEIINLNYKGTKLTYALAHSGLDRQSSRRAPLSDIESMSQIPDHPKLAIAGGINVGDIEAIMKYPIAIIIVGGAITHAEKPNEISEEIKNLINFG
jgi:3-hexulose-6-phosphate synthase